MGFWESFKGKTLRRALFIFMPALVIAFGVTVIWYTIGRWLILVVGLAWIGYYCYRHYKQWRKRKMIFEP